MESTRYSYQTWMKLEFSRTYLQKNLKYNISAKSVQ